MKDEAIEDVRTRRRQLIREKYKGSIESMIASCIAQQSKHPGRIVRPKSLHNKRAVA